VNLTAYDPSLLPSLTRLINAHTAFVPPYHHFPETAVDHVARLAHTLWESHYEDQGEDPAETQTFCIVSRENVLAGGGLILPMDRAQPAVIPWLAADPDHASETLGMLLGALTQTAAAAGFTELCDGRYAFGAGWFGVWGGWTHLLAEMQAGGFRLVEQHHILISPSALTRAVGRPSLPGYATGWHMNRLAGEWSLRAFSSDTQIGEALVWALNPAFEDSDPVVPWATLEWVEVAARFRRHGIASALLSEQLHFQARRGVKRLICAIHSGNHAALNLAQGLGFERAGSCSSFSLQLV
jgi:GNAT superfamily N-acetyltransferase